ncbi:MAG: 3-hydroxyacyl-CoA dehydrogenase family protein [Pseudomonadota bacterium]
MHIEQHARIAVVGAGLMGCGIAQVFLAAGHPVSLYDPYVNVLSQAPATIRDNLRSVGRDGACLELLTLCSVLRDAVDKAAIVFEAAPERLELKRGIFAELDAVAGKHVILASNTSVIPISGIAANLDEARRRFVIGTHWWNPPYLVPLVEVVRTELLAEPVFAAVMDLLARVGKVAVEVKKDVPGFVGNRLQHALWREAFALVDAGICDAATVDLVVKNSFGMRLPVLGPLENAEMVGLDLTLDIHRVVLQHLDASATPSPLLEELVAQGRLGMKSGQGMRAWTEYEPAALKERVAEHLLAMTRPAQAST